jgi:hypothetical protein
LFDLKNIFNDQCHNKLIEKKNYLPFLSLKHVGEFDF